MLKPLVVVLSLLVAIVLAQQLDGDDRVHAVNYPDNDINLIEDGTPEEGAEPNCHNNLAVTYKQTCGNKPGCSYVHLSTVSFRSVVVRNPTSPICADQPSGNGGKPSVYYNSSSGYEYITTGYGTPIYQVKAAVGQISNWGTQPAGHSYTIGLVQSGNNILLFTTSEVWETTVAPTGPPTVWSKAFDPTSIGAFLQQASLVAYNPATPNLFYYSGGFAPTVYVYQRNPAAIISEIQLNGFNGLPTTMFWSASLGKLIVTSDLDVVHALNPGNGVLEQLVAVPQGIKSATLNLAGDAFYSANAQFLTGYSIKPPTVGKNLLKANFNGTLTLGNFIYLK